MSGQIKLLSILFSIIEIIGLIIYIFQLNSSSLSEKNNTQFLNSLNESLHNIDTNNINKYYYYEEFKRILTHTDKKKINWKK